MTLVYHGREWSVAGPLTVREAMRRVGADPGQTMAVRRGEVLPLDSILADDGEPVDLIDIVAGG